MRDPESGMAASGGTRRSICPSCTTGFGVVPAFLVYWRISGRRLLCYRQSSDRTRWSILIAQKPSSQWRAWRKLYSLVPLARCRDCEFALRCCVSSSSMLFAAILGNSATRLSSHRRVMAARTRSSMEVLPSASILRHVLQDTPALAAGACWVRSTARRRALIRLPRAVI